MNRHPFDVYSAVLGVLATAAGAIAISGAVDPFANTDAGIWIMVAALAVGLLILPWGVRSQATPDDEPPTPTPTPTPTPIPTPTPNA